MGMVNTGSATCSASCARSHVGARPYSNTSVYESTYSEVTDYASVPRSSQLWDPNLTNPNAEIAYRTGPFLTALIAKPDALGEYVSGLYQPSTTRSNSSSSTDAWITGTYSFGSGYPGTDVAYGGTSVANATKNFTLSFQTPLGPLTAIGATRTVTTIGTPTGVSCVDNSVLTLYVSFSLHHHRNVSRSHLGGSYPPAGIDKNLAQCQISLHDEGSVAYQIYYYSTYLHSSDGFVDGLQSVAAAVEYSPDIKDDPGNEKDPLAMTKHGSFSQAIDELLTVAAEKIGQHGAAFGLDVKLLI